MDKSAALTSRYNQRVVPGLQMQQNQHQKHQTTMSCGDLTARNFSGVNYQRRKSPMPMTKNKNKIKSSSTAALAAQNELLHNVSGNVSLNEAEITTMVNDIVKDRTMFNTHQTMMISAAHPLSMTAKDSKKRKPALSLSAMAAELEEQQNLAL